MRHRLCWISTVLLLAFSTPAGAQKPDDAKNVARTLAETGRKRFESGDYAGAIEALRDAEKYFNAPTIKRMRALAHEKLGQLIEARAVYEAIASEKLPAGASPEFVSAQEESKKAVASLDTRIPRIEISLAHPPADTKVMLDGAALSAVQLQKPIRRNPGKYKLEIVATGHPTITRNIDLKEQSVEKVDIDFETPKPQVTAQPTATAAPTASAAPTATASAAPTSTSEAQTPPGGRSIVGPALAFGVGGAGLVLGAITGGLSFAKAAEVREACGGDFNSCPRSVEPEVEAGKTMGLVSTIGFVVGGVGVATGIILLVIPSNKPAPAKVGVAVGPSFIGVKGAF